MNIPRDYDTWLLRGPDEPDEPKMETCPECLGTGDACAILGGPDTGETPNIYIVARPKCHECHGTGEVEAEFEEYETERGEWLRDRRDGL